MQNTTAIERFNAAGKIATQTLSTWKKASSVAFLALLIFATLSTSGCTGLTGSAKTATNSQSTAAPASISVAPASLSFGTVPVGSTASQSVTVKNGGGSSLTLTQASATAAGVTITGASFPVVIDAGAQASFNVVFTPKTAGALSGQVAVVSSLSNTANTVSLSGTATAATSLLTVSASSLNFGNVALGKTSTLSVTLTNSGNSDVTLTNVSVSGASYSASGVSAGLILTPGQSGMLVATFTPAATGSLTGSVIVASNAANSLAPVTFSGDGTQAVANSVTLDWSPSTSTVAGYNVYRSEASGGPYTKVDTSVVSPDTYTDSNVQAGITYYYVVTSVMSTGVESPYSAQAAATVPAS
jgi:hypothetical protein